MIFHGSDRFPTDKMNGSGSQRVQGGCISGVKYSSFYQLLYMRFNPWQSFVGSETFQTLLRSNGLPLIGLTKTTIKSKQFLDINSTKLSAIK